MPSQRAETVSGDVIGAGGGKMPASRAQESCFADSARMPAELRTHAGPCNNIHTYMAMYIHTWCQTCTYKYNIVSMYASARTCTID